MKTTSKKMREARASVAQITNSYVSCLQVWKWLREQGADMSEFSEWNYDSGICYHVPTQKPVYHGWTEQKVIDFCKSIGVKPSVTKSVFST